MQNTFYKTDKSASCGHINLFNGFIAPSMERNLPAFSTYWFGARKLVPSTRPIPLTSVL